ncbi:MAG: septum site-determining protein MinC [Chloroflexi bacterium]|nr:septum site-determining protein MinC [Chloroflexota bacterium]
MTQSAMRSETSLVAIKGTKHGLTVTLLNGPVPDMLAELDDRLTRTAAFFKGAQVTLNVENPGIGAPQLGDIEALLSRHQITLRRLSASSPELAAAAAAHGLELVAPESPEPRNSSPALARVRAVRAGMAESDVVDADASYPAIVLRRTVRSGTAVRHEGHIIVVGDVNPGAELIASGDVIVWGKLRGLVHAGALGDTDAIVCALHLEPTQLRIANTIARMPDRKKRKPAPETAGIRDGKIEITEWS